MADNVWKAVDDFLESLHSEDDVLSVVSERAQAAGLPDIAVSHEQGRFLTVLARTIGATAILEIGTLGGYSAVCLARGLSPKGRLVTLEADEHHAQVARDNLSYAGVEDRVDVVVGPAAQTLPTFVAEWPDGFDLIFIDADKESYPSYWDWALRLAHPGTLIVADNVVRQGAIADATDDDALVDGVREYLKRAAAEPTVLESTIQTVGPKGHDGFSFAVVLGTPA